VAEKYINFVFNGMTHLRYFVPLAEQALKEGINSRFFIFRSNKYNCPLLPKNYNILDKICKQYEISLLRAEELQNNPGVVFLVEGGGVEYCNKLHKKISITYMTDFRFLYNNYVDKVDHILFPNKKFAEHYGTLDEKNLYLGSPKYDYKTDKEKVCFDLNLSVDQKYALIVYPRYRDLGKIPLDKIVNSLRKMELVPLIKGRGKEPVRQNYGCVAFLDENWYPHTTLDLINLSEIVVNFGSTAFKEAIMCNTPVINFEVKSHLHLSFLYDFDFVRTASFFDEDKFEEDISYFINHAHDHISKEFLRCKGQYLCKGSSSSKILKFLGLKKK
jgi:hypothetical protein